MFLGHIGLGINGPLHTNSGKKLIIARKETVAFLATTSLSHSIWIRLDI